MRLMRLKCEDLVKILKHPVKSEDKFAEDLIKDQRSNANREGVRAGRLLSPYG